jgi:NADH:ubiquinone oxidoreductase subunit F (NADH-binding)/(2Fe-2S) ferredoxin/Pyruvate/2-oxoacid:ferredoxin oxidoreductase delta subunit
MKLDTLELLQARQEEAARARSNGKSVLTVSVGTCGRARGAHKVAQAIAKQIKKRGLEGKLQLKTTGCHGFCEIEPVVLIKPDDTLYQRVSPEDAAEIVDGAAKGHIVSRLLYEDPRSGEETMRQGDVPFYKKQKRLLLGQNELLDPTALDDYLAIGGFSALAKALGNMKPRQVIEQIKKSGLRGRGGAGFLTGRKWEICASSDDEPKYIICNADEGDPGAYMDRSLLEGNPFAVIEGMSIGAYAIGASEGYIYVRTEYPLAVENVGKALAKARSAGLLGKKILGSDFSFDIKVARGAGAFVCGEETGLIASIEGRTGEPRQRPPYPARSGLWRKPTNINNVETWANVPLIISKGPAWFNKLGTEGSKGTKIFSLVGKIRNTGLVEVPMGITLREVVYDVGGGIPFDKEFKAVQTGGPSGGCIPASLLDLPVDFESLTEAGSMMGSGGMIVMDEDTCMVDVARYFLNFLTQESCGKCFSCREGTQRMLEIVTGITEGRGTLEDLDLLEETAQMVRDTSMCGLGQTAANPVLSTLRYFRDEYESHIVDRKCPAKVCKELIEFYIIPEKCTGCQRCVAVCPTGAITGPRAKPHFLDRAKCIKCRACYDVCRFEAIEDVIVDAVAIR